MCPPGDAHQLVNDGAGDLLYYVVANNAPADLFYYPDSDKWGATFPGRRPDWFRKTEAPYYVALKSIGVRVVVLNYCAYHGRRIVCDFVDKAPALLLVSLPPAFPLWSRVAGALSGVAWAVYGGLFLLGSPPPPDGPVAIAGYALLTVALVGWIVATLRTPEDPAA